MAVFIYNPVNGSFECTGSEPVTADKIVRYPCVVRLGSATDHVQVDEAGNLSLVGDATVWDDQLPSSVTIGAGASAPAFTAYSGNLKAYEFLGAALAKDLIVGYQFSHAYKEGSAIVPHIHLFVPDDAGGGTVKFGLEYTWTNVDEPGAVASTTLYGTLVRAAGAGILNNAKLSFGSVAGTGKKISSVLMTRLFRDPTDSEDTFGSSVWLLSADAHYERDAFGSRLITTK